MPLTTPSSSIFLFCAEFVAPVSGWIGGGVTLRGGERVNVFAEDAALVDRGRASKKAKGSVGEPRVACDGGVEVLGGGADDSKKEKSASAQESIVGSIDATGAAGGMHGLGVEG